MFAFSTNRRRAVSLLVFLPLTLLYNIVPVSGPTYTPGVNPADSWKLGISGSYEANYPPGSQSPLFQALLDSNWINMEITNVAETTVTALQTWDFRNGTQKTFTLVGDLRTGQGNITFFLLAGGLKAGDQAYDSPTSPTLNETKSQTYLGVSRTVNIYNATQSSQFGTFSFLLVFDQVTGVALEFVLAFYSASQGFYILQVIRGRITESNLWPAGADFTLSALPATFVLSQSSSATSNVKLQSINSFTGSLALAESINPNQNAPAISLNPQIVQLSAGEIDSSTFSVTTDESTILGLYSVTITAGQGVLSQSLRILILVTGPDFSIFASPTTISLSPGSTGTAQVILSSLNNFQGNIDLAYTIRPGVENGPTATLNPTMVSVPPNAFTTLTISTSSLTPESSYTVRIIGTSGSLSHSVDILVLVTVAVGDFGISASPASITMEQGSTATATATIDLFSIGSFSGTITLQSAVSPPGLEVSLEPLVIDLPPSTIRSSELTVTTAASTPTGLYTVTITGTSGPRSHSTAVSVDVVPVGQVPDFSMEVSPRSLVFQPGQSVDATVTLTSLNDFAGTVTLYALGPATTFQPDAVTLIPGGHAASTMTVTVDDTCQFICIGAVSVTASSGSISHRDVIAITIIRGSPPNFSISADPYRLSITAGSSAASTITLASLNDFEGTVDVSVPAGGISPVTPPGLTTSLNPPTVSLAPGAPGSSILTISTLVTTTPGDYHAAVFASGGGQTIAINVLFEIKEGTPSGDFTLSIQPSSHNVNAGSSAVSTITLVGQGFTGDVSLTATVSPQLADAPVPAISPSVITLGQGETETSALNIMTSASTPSDTYIITVTGTSGSRSHSATVSVTVLGVGGLPDFVVEASPHGLTISAGQSSTTTVTVTSINSFEGTVTLSAIALGSTTSFDRAMVSLTAGGSATSTLTVTVSSSTQPGVATVHITGTSSSLSHTDYITLAVLAAGTSPKFSIVADFYHPSITAGSSTIVTLTLTSLEGFEGSVSLSQPGTEPFHPSGLTTSLNPSTVTLSPGGSSYSAFTMSTLASTPPGIYRVGVAAVGGGQFMAVHIILEIRPAQPDFTIVPNPSRLTIQAGTSGTSTITLTSISGFQGTVSLSATSSPTGLDASLNPASPSLVPGGSVTSTLTVISGTPGTYTVTVTGSGGSVTQSRTIVVTVTPAPQPDFSIQSSPTSLVIRAGSSSSSTITLTSLHQFVGTVALSFTAPTGLTVTLDRDEVVLAGTGTGTSTLTLSASGDMPSGSYTTTVTGASGQLTHSLTITVMVQPAPFSVDCGQKLTCSIRSSTLPSNVKFVGNTISFTVEGPSGTTGSSNVTIPRAAVSNLDDVKVFVNRSRLPSSAVTITSDQAQYYVYFTYTFQSTVNIEIELKASPTTILGLDPSVFYSITGVAVAAIIGLIVIVARRRRVPTSRTKQADVGGK